MFHFSKKSICQEDVIENDNVSDHYLKMGELNYNIEVILLKTLVTETRWDGAVLFTLLPKGAGFSLAYKTLLTMSLNIVSLKNTRLIWIEG